MLKTLRTKTRKVMLTTLILIIPSFIFYFGWSSSRAKEHNRKLTDIAKFEPQAAYEDGVPGWFNKSVMLTPVELFRGQEKLRGELAGMLGPEQAAGLLREVDVESVFPLDDKIDAAIDEWYLKYNADKKGIQVSDRDLEDSIDKYFGGASAYERERYLQREGLTPGMFEQKMRDEERARRVTQSLYTQAKVTRAELWRAYLMEKQRLKLDYAVFEAAEYNGKAQITDANLEKYFKEKSEDFRVGDQRRYQYAFFPKAELEAKVQATSESVRRYYDENKDTLYKHGRQVKVRHILFPVYAKADAKPAEIQAQTSETLKKVELIRHQLLETNADFAKLADELSVDPRNTSSTQRGKPVKMGGLIDTWISEDTMLELGNNFIDAALKLEKGKISKETVRVRLNNTNNISLIKCEDARGEGTTPFDEIQQKVEEDFKTAELDRLFRAREQELSRKVGEYSSIATLAKELHMREGETSWVLKNSPVLSRDLILEPSDLESVNKEMRKGEMSQLMRTPDTLFVLFLTDEKATHIPADFREIRMRVEAAYKRDKTRELAKAAAEEYAKSVKAEDFKTTETSRVKLKTTDYFTRRDFPSDVPVRPLHFVQDTFFLQKDQIGMSEAGFTANEKEPSAFLVWHVRDLKNPSAAEFKKDMPRMEAMVISERTRGIMNEWLADNRNSCKVTKLIKENEKNED